MKTSDEGRSPSTKGSISGQKACGASGDSQFTSQQGLSSLSGVLPEEPESLPTSGVMTSPNFPAAYPNDLHERKTIEVAKGSVINIHFTDYELESPDQVDYVEKVFAFFWAIWSSQAQYDGRHESLAHN